MLSYVENSFWFDAQISHDDLVVTVTAHQPPVSAVFVLPDVAIKVMFMSDFNSALLYPYLLYQ